jgi:hypothetical protein
LSITQQPCSAVFFNSSWTLVSPCSAAFFFNSSFLPPPPASSWPPPGASFIILSFFSLSFHFSSFSLSQNGAWLTHCSSENDGFRGFFVWSEMETYERGQREFVFPRKAQYF